MKRLKPSPATLIASAALFFSLGGASFAASHYLITSTHQIAPWVRADLQGHAGNPGPRGLTGATGATGPQGPAGPVGPQATVHFDGEYTTTATADLCNPPQDKPPGQAPPCAPSAKLIVQCTANDPVVSGGFQGHDDIVTTNQLVATGAWEVVAHLDPSAPEGTVGHVEASVLCLKGTRRTPAG